MQSGDIYSKNLKNGQTAKTVEGEDIKVSVAKSGVKINSANVVGADVKAKNGVVHVIDAVILPPSM